MNENLKTHVVVDVNEDVTISTVIPEKSVREILYNLSGLYPWKELSTCQRGMFVYSILAGLDEDIELYTGETEAPECDVVEWTGEHWEHTGRC